MGFRMNPGDSHFFAMVETLGDFGPNTRVCKLYLDGVKIFDALISSQPSAMPSMVSFDSSTGLLNGIHTFIDVVPTDQQIENAYNYVNDNRFIRGDLDGDGLYTVGDSVAILDHLNGTTLHDCLDAVDANDDGALDISDPVYLIGFMFGNGSIPPAPFRTCAIDQTSSDNLDCASTVCP